MNLFKRMSAAAVLRPVTAALAKFEEVAKNNLEEAAKQNEVANKAQEKAAAHTKEAKYSEALRKKIASIIEVDGVA